MLIASLLIGRDLILDSEYKLGNLLGHIGLFAVGFCYFIVYLKNSKKD